MLGAFLAIRQLTVLARRPGARRPTAGDGELAPREAPRYRAQPGGDREPGPAGERLGELPKRKQSAPGVLG